MSGRVGVFILGMLTTVFVLLIGGYFFITRGGVPMETTASPLPFEETVARLAIAASLRGSRDQKDPLELNDENLVAGAKVYKDNCSGCHGLPGQTSNEFAKAMFPPAPQLFNPDEMVTDDPEGVTFWKVTHGIRLSGMPGFANMLNDQQRWQVSMLLAHADKLSPAVQSALSAH